MTIKVAPGTLSWIRKYPDQITLRVQEVADQPAAMEALKQATTEILSILGSTVRYFQGPLPTIDGGFFMLDSPDSPYGVLRTLPDVIAAHLNRQGVSQATISAGGLDLWGDALTKTPRAVVLCALPPPPATLQEQPTPPDKWFAEAAAWVCAGLPSGVEIMGQVHTQQFFISVGEAESFFRGVVTARPNTSFLISGDFASAIRSVNGRFRDQGSISFAAGGPAATDEDLTEIFDRLVEVARRLAAEDLSYAFISIEAGFSNFDNVNQYSDWMSWGGGERNMRYVWDEHVYDAFAYQILTAGHLKNLGKVPPGSRMLGDDKIELSIGRPEQWLLPPDESVLPMPGLAERRRDPLITERGRELLKPLLLKQGEQWPVFHARYRAPRLKPPGKPKPQP